MYWQAAAVTAALAAATGLVWTGRHRGYLVTGWLWYLVTLLPVIGIVQVGGQSHADRYTYVPLVGLFVMATWGARDLLKLACIPKVASALGATFILVALALAANQTLGYWKDSETLFRRAITVTKDNYAMKTNLALVLSQRGRHEEALAELEESLRICPDQVQTLNAMGRELAILGRNDEALEYFLGAVEVCPYSGESYLNAGTMLGMLGRPAEAVVYCRRAVELLRDSAPAHLRLAVVLAATGRTREAREQAAEAMKLAATDPAIRRDCEVLLEGR
jgi:tetratricopeptide (TPR) repeat protein